MPDIDLELLGLGAFCFVSTFVGALLMAKAAVRPPVAILIGALAIIGMGALVAFQIEGEGKAIRLLCAGTALAGGAAAGLLLTTLAVRTGLYASHTGDRKQTRDFETPMFGAGIAGVTAALSGATGGHLLAAATVLSGYFAVWVAGWLFVSATQKRIAAGPLVLVLPNVGAGLGLGLGFGTLIGG